MSNDHSFDILDIMPRLLDLGGEFHGFIVIHASENIVYGGPHEFRVVLQT